MKKIYIAPIVKTIDLCEESPLLADSLTGNGEGIGWGGEAENKEADSNRRGLGGGLWDDM